MTEFFASLFEFWGISPVSPNLGINMRGWDCESQIVRISYYDMIGWTMFGMSLTCFIFFYFLKDGARFNGRKHWFIVLGTAFLILFGLAFSISLNMVNMQDFTCKDYPFDLPDCLAFSFAAGFWCAAFYFIWSLLYRLCGVAYPAAQSRSINTRNTPWKQ